MSTAEDFEKITMDLTPILPGYQTPSKAGVCHEVEGKEKDLPSPLFELQRG